MDKGVSSDNLPTSIEEYYSVISKIPYNGKLRSKLTVVYENLHILGYYRGGVGVQMIKDGFMKAKEIVDMMAK